MIADKASEPLKIQRRRAVAGSRRGVVAGLVAQHELLVIVAGEKEPALIAVLELRQQQVGDFTCPCDIVGTKFALLHRFDQRAEQERVVVEIGIEMRATVLAGREQPAVAP